MYVNVDLLALATNANYFSTLTATNVSSPALSLLVYEPSFARDVLGPNATGSLVADLPWQAFHEAGIYSQADNSIYAASNYDEDPPEYPNITRISLDDYSIHTTHFPGLVVANGGTSYYPPGSSSSSNGSNCSSSYSSSELCPRCPPPLQLWADEGDFQSPSQLVAVDPSANTSTPVLTSFLGGRNFSSLNDVRQHPYTGDVWFTDADYGTFQDFRPGPAIPKQVYRFDPATGSVAAVADGFTEPNGLEFSPDLKTLYVTDTGVNQGMLNYTRPASIYAFDISPNNKTLGNRRLFAYVDVGSPDGIHTDTAGNVWAACGDGLHVWNLNGLLLGKVFLGETSNNFAFIPNGVLVFSNYRLWKVEGIQVQGREVCKDFGYCVAEKPSDN